MSPRTVDRTARRSQLVAAATEVFGEKGVSGATVADIVRAAGVAQGTFYLHFESKDDVIVAVVADVADRLLVGMSLASTAPGTSAVERMRQLGSGFAALSQDPALADMAEFIHRPENQRLHDRFAEQLLPRLIPLLERLIEDGVAEGSFRVPNTRAAAWFILGGLHGVELAHTPMAEVPAALAEASRLALRVLGNEEA